MASARQTTNAFSLSNSFLRNRNLIWQMTRREVVGRYRGSVIGLLWSFFHPITMLIIYTFVFSVVFRARWGTGGGSRIEFALVLFAGLIVFNFFSECVNRAPLLITSNVNFVKKVVFPLEVLPLVTIGAALFHAAVSLCVLIVFYILTSSSLHWTLVYTPIIMAPLLLFTLGISWFLASLGVFLRDVSQAIGLMTTILMFLSPIFYPVSAVPEKYQIFIFLNPLTFIIEQMRDVLIWGKHPSWIGICLATVLGILAAWLGLVWFQKTRKGFADVL